MYISSISPWSVVFSLPLIVSTFVIPCLLYVPSPSSLSYIHNNHLILIPVPSHVVSPSFHSYPPTTYARNRTTTRSAPFSLNKCQSYPLLSFYVLRIIIQGMKSLLITQHNHPTARFASFPLSLCQSYPLLLLYFFDHTCQIIINQGMRSLLVNKARCITTNIQIRIYF